MENFFGLLLGTMISTPSLLVTNPWSSFEGCYQTISYNQTALETKKLSTISEKISETAIYNPYNYGRGPSTEISAHFVLAHADEATVVDAFFSQGDFRFRREGTSYSFDGWIDASEAKPAYLSQEIHMSRDREDLNVTVLKRIDGHLINSESYRLRQATCSKQIE